MNHGGKAAALTAGLRAVNSDITGAHRRRHVAPSRSAQADRRAHGHGSETDCGRCWMRAALSLSSESDRAPAGVGLLHRNFIGKETASVVSIHAGRAGFVERVSYLSVATVSGMAPGHRRRHRAHLEIAVQRISRGVRSHGGGLHQSSNDHQGILATTPAMGSRHDGGIETLRQSRVSGQPHRVLCRRGFCSACSGLLLFPGLSAGPAPSH